MFENWTNSKLLSTYVKQVCRPIPHLISTKRIADEILARYDAGRINESELLRNGICITDVESDTES